MADEENKTLEEAFKALDEMVVKLESNDITLEDSFHLYKEGMDFLKYCNGKIDKVEKKMLQMNEDGTVSEF